MFFHQTLRLLGVHGGSRVPVVGLVKAFLVLGSKKESRERAFFFFLNCILEFSRLSFIRVRGNFLEFLENNFRPDFSCVQNQYIGLG